MRQLFIPGKNDNKNKKCSHTVDYSAVESTHIDIIRYWEKINQTFKNNKLYREEVKFLTLLHRPNDSVQLCSILISDQGMLRNYLFMMGF